MCPLRFILVFFSAVLAGYFALRTVRSSPDDPDTRKPPIVQSHRRLNSRSFIRCETFFHASDPSSDESTPASAKGTIGFRKVAENGFWGFVDMASGRYLWRSIKELRGGDRGCCDSKTS